MKLLEAGNATMGVWLGKQILGQTDEVRHEVNGSMTYLSVIMPRAIEAAPAPACLSVTRLLDDGGETDNDN
jgi:hypothetical protein